MAQLAMLFGNLKKNVEGKANQNDKGALSKLRKKCPWLVCPCSFVAISQVLQGHFHTFVLSLFSLFGIAALAYSQMFAWNSTVMDMLIGVAFVGPFWVSCTIAPKVQLSGVKTGVMGEIETLQHTNEQLKKKLQKYRENIVTLQKATNVMTTESKNQRLTVKKSMHISAKLENEDAEIESHVVCFKTSVKDIQNRRGSLNEKIEDFETRVVKYLDTQPQLIDADEQFKESQRYTEGVIKELQVFPERLGNGVESIEYIQEWYMSAGNCAKEVSPLLDQMKEEYARFSDLIRLQEMSFLRKLAYDIREGSDGDRFGREEYNIFVGRLPTYLYDVVIREQLKFKQYTANRAGLARYMGSAAVKRLLDDIVDGVSKVDQTAAVFNMPEVGGLMDQSAALTGGPPEPATNKKRGESSKNA